MRIALKKIIDLGELSNKEKLALATTVLVLFVVVATFLYSLDNKNKSIEISLLTVENMETYSVENTDRNIYWILSNIVNSFFASYNLEINAHEGDVDLSKVKYNRKDYYNVLHKDYDISKTEYMNITQNMFEKFKKMGRYGEYIPDIQLNNVYILNSNMYDKGMYLVKIKVFNNEEEYVYIGIKLNSTSKKFSIFYLK